MLGPVACKDAPLPAGTAVAIKKIKNIIFFISTNEWVCSMDENEKDGSLLREVGRFV